MSSPLVYFEGSLHVIVSEGDDWGVRTLDLAAMPRRLSGIQNGPYAPIRTKIDPYQTKACPTPAQLLENPMSEGDTWSAMTKRSLARFEAFFLASEDPQRRLDSREVVTLAHQVSLVRHILDNPNRRRVLIGDEVGLGKTVVAGLIVQELLNANSGLRVLYLAPARLVSNVGREFKRLNLPFREWKSQDGDARLETDDKIIASIHRAVHPNNFNRILRARPWDVIIVDECHHLSDWGEGGGDPVMKYRLVRDLVAAQSEDAYLLMLSGTPHQAHSARFENLLRLLHRPNEAKDVVAGRVIYRTKEDVRDWEGNPLFPRRQVNQPIVVDLETSHRDWLTAIHDYFKPPASLGTDAIRRAAGWKCAQALQWATSSPNAGLGYLVRQAMRAGWTLGKFPLADAIAALRPYRSGPPEEPVESVFRRIQNEIRRQSDENDVEDIEDVSDVERQDERIDHKALAMLIRQGIDLVRLPHQPKWDRLWHDVLQPAGNEKCVLFAQPIETVLALAGWLQRKTGVRPAIIIGGQSDAEREVQVEQFRSAAGPQFLISSRAGGEGINLQFSRRLVHLDVPWNPMEMEQRVGRVHRFGSRDTILVDTIVVRDSRETHAWRVARERLSSIAQTLVAPDRFETVFSRVMCLIPAEELQTVLINSPDSPLAEREVEKLSALVDSGFRDWQGFHDRYAANQRQIREQPAGLARWSHLRDFLVRHGGAVMSHGFLNTRFTQRDGQVQPIDSPAEVLKLGDGTHCFVGDYEGGLFSGQSGLKVDPLGLNISQVSKLLRSTVDCRIATGAAHLRWSDTQKELRAQLGDEAVILAFLRQSFRLDSVGGVSEIGTELLAYQVGPQGTFQLTPNLRAALFSLYESSTIRVKPVDLPPQSRITEEEARIVNDLRRPSESELRERIRYSVWPILAIHISQ